MSSSKPTVLFIIQLPPPVHGASTVNSLIKSSKLINENLDSTFINLSTTTSLDEPGKDGFKKITRFAKVAGTVIQTLFRNKFDLCHITLTASGQGFYKDLLIVFLVKISGTKIVYHFHNKGVANASKKFINRILYRFAFKNTSSILLSAHLYKDIELYVKEKDVYYCANGIAPRQLLIKSEMPAMHSETCKLLYLSNMIADKGAFVLLDAVSILKQKRLSFECHFVGAWADITETHFKQQIEKAGLSELVYAHGPKYAAEKESFLQQADIFIFPTYYHYETFGLVNLEAMQFSLPIIATPEGGIPDVVIDNETGFLVPQKNSTELAGKIEVLIKNPVLRETMGKAGKKRYEDFFTLDHFEKNLLSILKTIIKKEV